MPQITIPYNFTPRSYQLELFKAMDSGVNRAFVVFHRRAGKDISCFNYMIKRAIQDRGIYYYVFPQFNQGRRILWDNKDFMSYCPNEIVERKNSVEMKIELVNGSIIQIIGSDHYDALRGTSPKGVIMSEYAFQHPLAWETIRPILVENGGWIIFNTTPNGKNHAFDLWEYAKQNDTWYTDLKSVEDTKSVDMELLKEEEESMEKSMFRQEYYCDFNSGAIGAYYSEEIKWLYDNNRVRQVDYDPNMPVMTFWDLGINDPTAIWFIQDFHGELRVIDHYEAQGDFVKHLTNVQQKGYNYSKHVFPHDIKVREFTTGKPRIETAQEVLGNNCEVAPNLRVDEGIARTKVLLRQCFFDKEKCKTGLKLLENYRQEYDELNKIFKKQPLHDFASHTADAMRYAGVSVQTKQDPTPINDVWRFREKQKRDKMRSTNPYSPI
jgi:hypothetical protein